MAEQEPAGSRGTEPRIPPAKRRHEEVVERLRHMIRTNLKPGDQLPTVRALMADLGVSMTTLRAAQAVLSHEGLIAIHHGSGVTVTEKASFQRAGRVGILSELDLIDPRVGLYHRLLANALKRQLKAGGYETRLHMGDAAPGREASGASTCPQFWTELAAGQFDGVVILNTPWTHAWKERVRGIPVPSVGSMTGFEPRIDLETLATAAFKRLAADGCRRVGVLAWRHQGTGFFSRIIAACGLEPNEAWIRCDDDPTRPGAGWEGFQAIWSADCGRPDGLVILDDMLFAGAQLAILELGVRVPGDLRLAIQATRGSDLPIRVPATVYEIDPDEAAGFYAAMLVERLSGRQPQPPDPVVPFRELASQAWPAGIGVAVHGTSTSKEARHACVE